MTKKDIFSLARKEILKLIPYKSARDDFSSDQKKMIMMDANENPFQTEFNRYPDPNQIFLKNSISKIKTISNSKIFLSLKIMQLHLHFQQQHIVMTKKFIINIF